MKVEILFILLMTFSITTSYSFVEVNLNYKPVGIDLGGFFKIRTKHKFGTNDFVLATCLVNTGILYLAYNKLIEIKKQKETPLY